MWIVPGAWAPSTARPAECRRLPILSKSPLKQGSDLHQISGKAGARSRGPRLDGDESGNHRAGGGGL